MELIAGENKRSGKILYTEEELLEKMDKAFEAGNAEEYNHWFEIYMDKYPIIHSPYTWM